MQGATDRLMLIGGEWCAADDGQWITSVALRSGACICPPLRVHCSTLPLGPGWSLQGPDRGPIPEIDHGRSPERNSIVRPHGVPSLTFRGDHDQPVQGGRRLSLSANVSETATPG